GTNPSLTIAALADRMCTRLLEQPRPAPATAARGTGARETGGAGQAGRTGGAAGPESQQPASFRLTITADDVEQFLEDPEHSARAEGWIDAAILGGRRQIQRGWFDL